MNREETKKQNKWFVLGCVFEKEKLNEINRGRETQEGKCKEKIIVGVTTHTFIMNIYTKAL